MSRPRKRNRTADKKPALIKKLRGLALAASPDRLSDELYTHIEKMVEAGLEADIEAVIADPSLGETGSDSVERALEEAGYRLSVLLQTGAADAAEPSELGVVIPFALIFLVAAPEGDLARLPTELPVTVARLTENKWLRQALGLGDEVSLFVDGHLYRIDHAEWQSALAVRRYLQSIVAYITRQPLAPEPRLAADYAQPSQFEQTPGDRETTMALVARVLCGVVLVGEGEAAIAVEERLFEAEDVQPIDLEPFIQAELASHNLAQSHGFGLCTPLELWDVPREGLALRRLIGLRDRAARARSLPAGRLTSGAPVWRLDVHPSAGRQAVTVQAYPSGAVSERPLFRYTWEVVETVEDIDAVLEDFRQVAQEYGARLLMPGEIAPGQAGWRSVN